MKTKHILAIAIAVATSTLGIVAQPGPSNPDTLTLTLQQCRDMALSKNYSAQTMVNNISIARETSEEAFTKYFPEISASGGYFWANHDVIQYNVLNLFELGMIDKGYTVDITAIQPIFAGGRIVNGNALAHVGERVAELRKLQSDEEILASVDKYYWKLVSLHSQRNTLASLIEMLDTLAYQTKAAVDAGVILKNEELKVELQRNDFRSVMIDLDNGIALCGNLLGQYIGAGVVTVNVTERVDPANMPAFSFDLWRDPEQAVSNTPTYGLLNSAVKAAELEKKIEIGNNLPTVGLGAGWFFHNLLDENMNFGALMISVKVPLSGWWGGTHNIKKKEIQLQNARLQLEDGQELLQIAMRDAWDNLTSAYRKMETAHEAIGQAEENLRLNRNYYDVGVSTITDLLDAQTLYRRACDQYIAAYADFRVRTTDYLKATGQLTQSTDL
ncbi:MAG: TolC family protein [Bacteroides sp.]|nr:TolC family protein [Bacteroides sp.]MCM1412958.1 TolC family protein [Bacteroides sp.]MCM1471664.1 TolC family protein [Bacteroides sp.]